MNNLIDEWKALDTDGSGTLTIPELQVFIKKSLETLNKMLPPEQQMDTSNAELIAKVTEASFNQIDTNKSGSIEFKEYARMISKTAELYHMEL